MIASKTKKEDVEFRASCLELMLFFATRYQKKGNQKDLDQAKFYGDISSKLKKKIETYDYSEDDRIRNEIDAACQVQADLIAIYSN